MSNEMMSDGEERFKGKFSPKEFESLKVLKRNMHSPKYSEFARSNSVLELPAITGLNDVNGQEIFDALVDKKTVSLEQTSSYLEKMADHYGDVVKSIRTNPQTIESSFRTEDGEEAAKFTFSHCSVDKKICADYVVIGESDEYLNIVQYSYKGENEVLHVNPDGEFEYTYNAAQTHSGRGKTISVTWNTTVGVKHDVFSKSESILRNTILAHQSSLREPEL